MAKIEITTEEEYEEVCAHYEQIKNELDLMRQEKVRIVEAMQAYKNMKWDLPEPK